jgi:hypothetical protein
MLKFPSETKRYFTNCFSLISLLISSTISGSFLLNVASKLNELITNLISFIKSVIIFKITHSVIIANRLIRS